jgi:hypothetical protein
MNNEQKSKYAKERYKKNRERLLEYQNKRYNDTLDIFQRWRKTLKCCRCGENDVACLEFHHSNPETKENNVIRMVSRSVKSVIKELKKCVVVCANCHRRIHAYDIKTDPDAEDLGTSFDFFYREDLTING